MASFTKMGGPILAAANTVNNTEVVQLFSDNTTIGTSYEVIGNGNATHAHPVVAGADIDVVSADAADASAGTGAQTIRVWYLDSNFDKQYEDISMNGVTEVEMTHQTITYILFAEVLTTGTGLASAGAITIADVTGGTVHAIIDAGATYSGDVQYMIPRANKGYIYGFWFDVDPVAAGAGTIEVALQIAPFATSGVANSETWQTVAKLSMPELDSDVVAATGGNSYAPGKFEFPGGVPFVLPAKCMARVVAKSGTGTTAGSGGMQIVLAGENSGTVTTSN